MVLGVVTWSGPASMALELHCEIGQVRQSRHAGPGISTGRQGLHKQCGDGIFCGPPRARPVFWQRRGSRRAADSKVLRFVPQANLANLDPIWTTQYVVRNGSLLIWDTLFGVNDKLEPQPQMVEAYEVTPDFKTWTFRLRPGLKFHDNEPVLAKDVVASINRWMPRDSTMGVPIKRQLDALDVGGRPHLPLPPQSVLPEAALRAWQKQHAGIVHHAGADRRHRPVQANQRLCRFRTDALQKGRMGARFRRGVRTFRRL